MCCRARTCCCCLSLETGTKLIAFAEILIGLVSAIISCFKVDSAGIVTGVIAAVTGIILYMGARKRSGALIIAWLVISFIVLAVYSVEAVASGYVVVALIGGNVAPAEAEFQYHSGSSLINHFDPNFNVADYVHKAIAAEQAKQNQTSSDNDDTNKNATAAAAPADDDKAGDTGGTAPADDAKDGDNAADREDDAAAPPPDDTAAKDDGGDAQPDDTAAAKDADEDNNEEKPADDQQESANEDDDNDDNDKYFGLGEYWDNASDIFTNSSGKQPPNADAYMAAAVLAFLIALVNAVLLIYFWVIVLSFYRSLKEVNPDEYSSVEGGK